jgi:iron complex transport system ATP-binding protein
MISLENVSFSYNGDLVLDDISFSVSTNEVVGIIGPNGAGKSTLLKLLDRLVIPSKGQIFLDNLLLKSYSHKKLARMIGFVPQTFMTVFDFSAYELVLMGRYPHQRPLEFESSEDRQIVQQVMEITDCYHLKDRKFLTLSGGERQRVVLASALAQEPSVLLLDEPTTALDLKHQVHFYSILRKLREEKEITILTVTHDINLAIQFCQRILVLKKGQMIVDGPVNQVIEKKLLEDIYETEIDILYQPDSQSPVILPKHF